jgi:hypothetical protein
MLRPFKTVLSQGPLAKELANKMADLEATVNHRFFRVDESLRASTRAGLTRARSLSTWVYSERNAVTHLPVHSLLMEVSCNPKVALGKNQEKKEKVESRKTSVRKNIPFSPLRSKIALKTPRLRPLKY